MKVLLIGFGSIGKRHFDVLSSLPQISSIDLLTQQKVKICQCYKKFEEIKNLNVYDYFVIASPTYKHYEQLQYLEKNVSGKLILCEKPLFETTKNLHIRNNQVFVGYVLRFHPLLLKLKEFIKNEKIISFYAKCGQYLPTWRPQTDYRDSYSAKKREGGGVLLDLSHEIDYAQWICGVCQEIKSYQSKVSDLEIDSDDLTMFIAKTSQDVFVNISMDYISKISHRRVVLETLDNTYELDFIANKLTKKDRFADEEIYDFSTLEKNLMFEQMHIDILSEQKYISTFEEGLEVMQTITTIEEQNR